MNRISFPARLVSAVGCFFLGVSGAGAQGIPNAHGPRSVVTNYMFCTASEGSNPTKLYYSGAFVTVGPNLNPVQDAFLAFLKEKYSFKENPAASQQVGSRGMQSLDEAKTILKVYVDRDRKDSRYQVIETGWTPGASSTPPPATAAGQPPAAPPATSSNEIPGTAKLVAGVYNGSLECSNGKIEINFKLSLKAPDDHTLNGILSIQPHGNAASGPAAFSVANAARVSFGTFNLKSVKWETPAPAPFVTMATGAAFDTNRMWGGIFTFKSDGKKDTLTGFENTIAGAACPVSATRSDAETARIDSVMAEQVGRTAAPKEPAPAAAATAQPQITPAAGTTVPVKMLDSVDSGSDPSGRQYRATVTRAVNAGAVDIPQGAAATVALSKSPSGWGAQLHSLVIDGQTVAVSSNSASVTTTAPGVVGSAANKVGSVLGGLGRRAPPPPPPVAAVASGSRVVLPSGTGLNFVLSTPPASAVANAPIGQSSNPVSGSGPDLFQGFCFSVDLPDVIYVSEIFPTNVPVKPMIYGEDTRPMVTAFREYLQQRYAVKTSGPYSIACHLDAAEGSVTARRTTWSVQSHRQSVQAQFQREKKPVVETGWMFKPAQ